MNIGEFANYIDYNLLNEAERAEAICFYIYKETGLTSFQVGDIATFMIECGSNQPNQSRLKTNLLKRPSFRRSPRGSGLELTEIGKYSLEKSFGNLWADNESIQSSGKLLDEGLFCGKLGYLDRFIQQINHCYENNCYDAAAVLMRRVMEIALIQAFEARGYKSQITTADNHYIALDGLIKKAISGNYLILTQARSNLESIKLLGNYAAHGIAFTTRKKDIEDIKLPYRILLEELYRLASLI